MTVIDSEEYYSTSVEEENGYNVIIKNCTISNIRQGSVVVNETRSLVVDTFITNSSTGIISNDGDVEMMNVVVTGCAASSLQDGSLVVRGMLGMHHSSLQVKNQVVSFQDSKVIFQRAPQSSGLSLTGFSATDSFLFIRGNSSVILMDFNLTANSSAMLLLGSDLEVSDKSKLIFTSNT